MFVAQRLRHIFRATQEEGIGNSLMKIISVPLTGIRTYTIPIPEEAAWDRNRAAIIPITITFALFYLYGLMDSDSDETTEAKENPFFVIGLIAIIPGAIIGTYIKLKTKKT